jgi:hypothetical protein
VTYVCTEHPKHSNTFSQGGAHPQSQDAPSICQHHNLWALAPLPQRPLLQHLPKATLRRHTNAKQAQTRHAVCVRVAGGWHTQSDTELHSQLPPKLVAGLCKGPDPLPHCCWRMRRVPGAGQCCKLCTCWVLCTPMHHAVNNNNKLPRPAGIQSSKRVSPCEVACCRTTTCPVNPQPPALFHTSPCGGRRRSTVRAGAGPACGS